MKTTCPKRIVVSSLTVLLACQVAAARGGDLRDKLKGKLNGFTETSTNALKDKMKDRLKDKLNGFTETSANGLKDKARDKLKGKLNGFTETSTNALKDKVKD